MSLLLLAARSRGDVDGEASARVSVAATEATSMPCRRTPVASRTSLRTPRAPRARPARTCPDGPGVTGGNLVDPAAFFAALVKGKSATDWMKVMNDIEPTLWACGVGQQRDSGGTVRGRLFLPTAGCADASPPAGDALAIKLGVRHESGCWTHAVDVLDGGS